MSTTIRAACRWTFLAVSLAILGGLIVALTRPSLYPPHVVRLPLVGAAWIAFGVSAFLVRKVAVRTAAGLILVAGIALQALAFTTPPAHSSDMYRYMWDGQVQAAGIDPYMYPPTAAALVPLRNDFLWTPSASGGQGTLHPYCVKAATSTEGPAFDTVAGCARINRVNVPTIYPPVAEAWFTLVYLAAGDASPMPMQVAMALCAILTTVILLWGLRRLGRDPRLAVLWAWCPLTILEVGNDAHSDVLGVLLTLIALLVLTLARTRKRLLLGGTLLGLALATKLTPAFVFPGVLRRGWQYILAAAVTATVIVYVPHLIAAGSHVIGFFPGYIKEQGYSNGSGYQVLALFVHGKKTSAVAFLLMGIVALAILRYCDPAEPWRGGIYMMAAALVIGTPQFEWYSILLVLLVALDGRWEWLTLCAGAYLANHSFLTAHKYVAHPRVWGYGGGLAVALAITGIRYWLARRSGTVTDPGSLAVDDSLAGAGADAGAARTPVPSLSLPAGYRGGNT
jgi:hypothetical protein